MLNSFKVQNRFQAQSEQVKVFKRKYESYEKMPINTINQSVSQYNKKVMNGFLTLVLCLKQSKLVQEFGMEI